MIVSPAPTLPGNATEGNEGVSGIYVKSCLPSSWSSLGGVSKPHKHLLPRLLMAISFRTLNGLGILVCSMDGSVAFLDFSQDELGDPLSEEEKVRA